ncbi:hypothetical protein BR93DRAFT_302847 [Coniochaeta sp. PMI_546]|nr:hypothetical protein BR93DRAFT_302847 [Coniochaeta sp. PMI_546]
MFTLRMFASCTCPFSVMVSNAYLPTLGEVFNAKKVARDFLMACFCSPRRQLPLRISKLYYVVSCLLISLCLLVHSSRAVCGCPKMHQPEVETGVPLRERSCWGIARERESLTQVKLTYPVMECYAAHLKVS